MSNVVEIRVLAERVKYSVPPVPVAQTQTDCIARTRLILERMEVTANLGQRILDKVDKNGTEETMRAIKDVLHAFAESIREV